MPCKFYREFAQSGKPRFTLFGHAVEQVFLFQYFEDGECGRTGHRRAAEGGAVAARGEKVGPGFGDPDSTDRKSSTEAFGHCDGIWVNACVLKGEETSGASNAALHFVEQEQESAFVAEFPQFAQKIFAAGQDTGLALDGLY